MNRKSPSKSSNNHLWHFGGALLTVAALVVVGRWFDRKLRAELTHDVERLVQIEVATQLAVGGRRGLQEQG